ncbi:hypothetical protein CTI12_AA591790 [Artemisia annua]|uniref:Uncharacterized protein n=1 Tax=Artemisia annua TaxID=35608 RepID=A0A2U1KJW1_ARTAN|nr:hypothetical protein CTI12_AA591790 [Artemisia annua]
MATDQGIQVAPQWAPLTPGDVNFKTNNALGNFSYPSNVSAYKDIVKFLYNCPLNQAFTSTPYFQYHNYLRELWATIVAYDPSPPTDKDEQRPLREYLISFSVLNGTKRFTLDFQTFCSSTGLDYNNGIYVEAPHPDVVKTGLKRIALKPENLDKTPITKFLKDPSSVSNIELTDRMVAVNNLRDSVSPPLPAKGSGM